MTWRDGAVAVVVAVAFVAVLGVLSLMVMGSMVPGVATGVLVLVLVGLSLVIGWWLEHR